MQRFILVSISLLMFASCSVMQPNKMFDVPGDYQYSEFKPSKNEYIIQSFDKLTLQIFTNEGISLIGIESNTANLNNNVIEYLVEYDGRVKVPVLGRIMVQGLTVKEAEEMLEKEYAKYYQKPFVIVHVVNRRVILFSNGSGAGRVIPLLEENFTLIEAIAQAGGISDFGKAYKVKLIRGDLKNPEVYLFNLSKLSDLEKVNLLLEANDIIYVDTRPKYASRLLSEISPYLGLLTTVLLIVQLTTQK